MIADKMRVNKVKFGKFIATKREEMGYTNQTLLAKKLNLSTGAIGKIEAGERLPSFDTFIDLADALQMTPGQLMMVMSEREEPSRYYVEVDSWFYDRLKGMIGEYERVLDSLTRPEAGIGASPMPVYRLEEMTPEKYARLNEADKKALEESNENTQEPSNPLEKPEL